MRQHSGVRPEVDPPLKILLVEPEIPGNTGTIGRLSMATRCPLYLVEPLGFETDAKALRRAGLDYWPKAEVYYYSSLEEVQASHPNAPMHFLTTHATTAHSEIPFQRQDFIVFGSETSGLPSRVLQANPNSCYRIPMWKNARSLNLAVAVGVVLYEGLRQLGEY